MYLLLFLFFTVVPIVLEALLFDERRGSYSVGEFSSVFLERGTNVSKIVFKLKKGLRRAH